MLANATPARSFVPTTFDVADWSQIEPLCTALLARPLNSVAEVERWLADFSELYSIIDEYYNRRYIDMSCHTDDPAIESAFLHYVEEIEPRFKPLFFQLQKKLLRSPHRTALSGKRYDVLLRQWQADVDLFRDANVPLETENTRLVNEYAKTCGAMMIAFRGNDYTPQQMARFGEEPDRATREEAWILTTRRRLADREAIDAIYDKMIPLRHQLAVNAGLKDYRAFMWKSLKRFDYTPEDCLRFADSIERYVVPIMHELDRQRAAHLKLPALRPWDMSVDPQNRPPLRPFVDTDVERLVSGTHEIFRRVSPALADQFDILRRHNSLDLASRKGKQPGGYQANLNEIREPFIFMNAAGVQRDVETLLHEGGHAFHLLASREEPLVFLSSAPTEFSEVASMAMELFGAEHFDVFYDDAGGARARRGHLEAIIRRLPWIATIDLFQHWVYTHPQHSRDQRTHEWLAVMRRFDAEIDWTGLDDAQAAFWQRQLHLFHVPYYYVEYAIAQLGALQLWMKAKEDPQRALSNYRAGLRLGGSRPLPELFAAAGISFDFSEKTLRPLMNAVADEIASLPA